MPQADVIVAMDRDTAALRRCIQGVLEHSGEHLRRLILVGDSSRQPSLGELQERLPSADARVVVVPCPTNLSHVDLCNRGLGERAGDAVLLFGQVVVSAGWLAELAAVAHAEERTACAAPLSDREVGRSVPGASREMMSERSDATTVRAACAGLPRWTAAPVMTGPCIYLRGDVLSAVGLLDDRLTSPQAAIADWLLRAQSLGFMAKRANHVFVHCPTPFRANAPCAIPHDQRPAVLDERYPPFEPGVDGLCRTLDADLAAHAVRLEATGKLQVAYDIRHVPAEQVGTRTYAISLARALALLPEIELTLLVRKPAQARGLKGRVQTPEQWTDDVALIHKPGQVVDRGELRLLFESSAHVIITYQDLIAFRIPSAFPGNARFEEYRATSRLTLPAAQRLIAFSESVGSEIASEFGIPREEIPVVALGVEAARFSDRRPGDRLIRSALRLPERYFFSVASDYPHKNLDTLLDAYGRLRSRWKNDEPPWLVLAGYPSGARNGLYLRLESEPLDGGVIFLGPVRSHQLRVLYRQALALVFPSLYEGFGLPPLEAMAAGTPVIAMPISAVPEVGGNCVLYPDGLSAADLARAMEHLATSEPLRDDLREKGRKWVEHFRWEKTARATLEVYRSTVLRPSERSLHVRRLLRDAIIGWSDNGPAQATAASSEYSLDPIPPSMGIRDAWRSLQVAVRARLRRELRRFPPIVGRRSA